MRTLHSWYQAPVALMIGTAVTFLALTAALAFLSWVAPLPATAQDACVDCEACTLPLPASLDSGSANRVGVVPLPGRDAGAQVGILVKFSFNGALNLSASTVTIDAMLNEEGGAGELLLSGLPSTLSARPGSKPTAAIYETPSRAIPKLRLEIQTKGQGLYDFLLRVERATIPKFPQLCAGDPRLTTNLATRFTITDPGSLARASTGLGVSIVQPWRCLDLTGGDPKKSRSLRAP